MSLSGHEYANLIATYIIENFGGEGVLVYREVELGKTIIGKNRRLDILVRHLATGQAVAVECKYQATSGSAEEKLMYTLDDLKATPVKAVLAYAGDGFSAGILRTLAAAPIAAHCLPDPNDLRPSSATRELDHLLAAHFGWWPVILKGKTPFTPT